MPVRARSARPAAVALALPALLAAQAAEPKAGLERIDEAELEAHVALLASPALEGRDSPSRGLELAARYLVQHFAALGLEPVAKEGLRLTFSYPTEEPVADRCNLELSSASGEPKTFQLGSDFVPVAGCNGECEGELVFVGFGIDDSGERYDELPGRLDGKVALLIEAEPEHPRRFEGPERTVAASLWTKLGNLREVGAAGVLVMRRRPAKATPLPADLVHEGDGDVGFRYEWAHWMGAASVAEPVGQLPPVAEIDADCAAALLGADVEELAREADHNGRPPKWKAPAGEARHVRLACATRSAEVPISNVVGRLAGSDPALATECVVIGAHYDHVGVDERGRIGFGADDNASGTSALLELAQAFAAARPRRSVVFCAFAAEEKGLVGSQAFCDRPPFSLKDAVAMLNLDMLGRGGTAEVAVLGSERNPDLERALERGRKLAPTGVKKLVLGQGQDLWQRSDHYSFHQAGVPSLFFFEGVPIERNPDYHTWRDTPDRLDFQKIANTTRLVFCTAWILCNDDDRPTRSRD
jgi:Peptidase family M28